MNPLKNPIFLMGGVLMAFGAIAHSTGEDLETCLFWAGGMLILVSFFVHVKPLQIGSLD